MKPILRGLLGLVIFFSGCNQLKEKISHHPNGKISERYEYILSSDGRELKDGAWLKYFDDGKLIEKSQWSEGVQMGLSTSWYTNGTKKSETNWVGGKKEGLEKRWYENGDIKSEIHWKAGIQDGAEVTYHTGGIKKSETQFVQGQRNGALKIWNKLGMLFQEREYIRGELKSVRTHVDSTQIQVYRLEYGPGKLAREYGYYLDPTGIEIKHGLLKEWYPSGNIEREVSYIGGVKWGIENSWYENGKKKQTVEWEQGEKNGTETFWYENGEQKISEEFFINGKLTGVAKKWYPSGSIQLLAHYKLGQREGTLETFNSKGQKVTQVTYRDDKKEGEELFFHQNGVKSWECIYHNNTRNGLCKSYYPSGKLMSEIFYRQGVRIAGTLREYSENGELLTKQESGDMVERIQMENHLNNLAQECIVITQRLKDFSESMEKGSAYSSAQKKIIEKKQLEQSQKEKCLFFHEKKSEYLTKYGQKYLIDAASRGDYSHLL